ncbi:MAG: DUF4145 domain-containing protein [Deltaproteobacteria bacterium]|jgi:hypothetical protein|nr:DUF4145 domain-containing protein [Deltaproteobacteria bacterium]
MSCFHSISLDCPHCLKSEVGFTFVAAAPRKPGVKTDMPFQATYEAGAEFNTFWRCNVCGDGIVIIAKAKNKWTDSPSATKTFEDVFEKQQVYPKHYEPAVPKDTPLDIAELFIKGQEYLKTNDFEACALKLRRVIDLYVDKNKNKGEDVKAVINRLVADGEVAPCIAKWAFDIKYLESQTLHGFRDINPEEAQDFVTFTELFLTCIYTIPEMLKKRIKRPEQTSAEPGASRL